MFKVFSMFSGICTAEVGIQRATKNAVFVGRSEIDKYAEAIAQFHFPTVKNYGDATKLIPDELPDFSFFVAGFPCQNFSIAGKRQGFNEARGTLFFEIARILSHKRPAHFLLENVGGLRSHDGGRTMQRILRVLSDLGYFVEVPLLNSKDYGVPQNRERVFFIGHLGGRCEREILSVGNGDEEYTEINEKPSDISNAIDANYYKGKSNGFGGRNRQGVAQMMQLETTKGNSQGSRVYHVEGIGSGLKSQGGGGSAKCPMIVVPVLTPDRPTKRQNGRRFKKNGDEAFTLTAQDRHGVMIEMETANCLTPDAYLTRGERKRDENGKAVLTSMFERRIRRLTPIECERLQGLPDDFTKYGVLNDVQTEISDTQRYKCTGNAMTTFVIEAIVAAMIEKGCLGSDPVGAGLCNAQT